jgi:lysophospholipase L1-like esterase
MTRASDFYFRGAFFIGKSSLDYATPIGHTSDYSLSGNTVASGLDFSQIGLYSTRREIYRNGCVTSSNNSSSSRREPSRVVSTSVNMDSSNQRFAITRDRISGREYQNVHTIIVSSSALTKREIEIAHGLISSVKSNQVFCDGNSLTAGQGATSTNLNYVGRMQSNLGGGWLVVNCGVGAQTTTAMINDASGEIDSRMSFLSDKKIVCAWEIGNELYYGVNRDTAYNNFLAYCNARRAVGWKVVVGTITPRTIAAVPANFETDRLYVNNLLRTNYLSFADALADVGSDATIGQTGQSDNTTYYTDKVHFTDAGYALVEPYFRNAVLSL